MQPYHKKVQEKSRKKTKEKMREKEESISGEKERRERKERKFLEPNLGFKKFISCEIVTKLKILYNLT